MEHPALKKMTEMAKTPDALEATVDYLTEKLSFLKKNEKVLLLFPDGASSPIGSLMAQAVRRREGNPIFWEGDKRWKTLLRLAFSTRASTVIGEPLVILGLSKLARFCGTPLYIRNVVTAGYPCLDWMIDGIIKGLDCRTWGCFDPGGGNIVAGFSCGRSRGVHLRDDVYAVEILAGSGEVGDVVLYPKADPELKYHLGERARLETFPCPCGCKSPRLIDLRPGTSTDMDLEPLGQHLQSWTSILDCRLKKGSYGLEMEIITFPGEKLPKLPSCARQVVRPWDPEKDAPFYYAPGIEKM